MHQARFGRVAHLVQLRWVLQESDPPASINMAWAGFGVPFGCHGKNRRSNHVWIMAHGHKHGTPKLAAFRALFNPTPNSRASLKYLVVWGFEPPVFEDKRAPHPTRQSAGLPTTNWREADNCSKSATPRKVSQHRCLNSK